MSDYALETRQDRITKEWVACSPVRSTRPHKTTPTEPAPASLTDEPVEGCPFCPGHEEMLPSVIWQLDAHGERPWWTRAVPNKYPAFTPDAKTEEQTCGLYRVRASHGRQEVLVDTPFHHQGLAKMPTRGVEAVLHTYLQRYHVHRQADESLLPVIFRNHGPSAGASIPHPHSQLIATDFPPPRLEHEEAEARARYEELNRCPYCAMIDTELATESRLVETNEDFVVFVPYAARVPYEMWIFPREHRPEFGRLAEPQRHALAQILREVLGRLHASLDDPDYNFFVRTALEYESDAPHLHWSLRIRPRLTVEAGFEVATGMHINPSIPERDAAVLRGDQ